MINRNNYEEYLLLYLDGELSAAEQQAVETFLSVNPDIQEELELLRQTILQPEAIYFDDKNSLYREAGINVSNCSDWFLLYVDNELTIAERNEVETFVLQHPAVQEEFTQLKQTVLPREEIVFASKELLYRREEKRKPVIVYLRWASLAAAVIMGAVALLTLGKNEQQADMAGLGNDKKTEDVRVVSPAEAGKAKPAIPNVNENTITAIEPQKSKKDGNKIILQPLNIQQQENKQPEIVAYQQPEQKEQNVGSPAETGYTEPTTVIATTEGTKRTATDIITEPVAASQDVPTGMIETEDDKTIMVGALQVNPDKVRGFFRKATRFLSNKIKDNDSPGEKLKIANLELNKSK